MNVLTSARSPASDRAAVARFAILSLLCVIGLALATGFVLSSILSRAASKWEFQNMATAAQREVEFVDPEALFALSQGGKAHVAWHQALAGLFTRLPEVQRIKVWDRDGTLLWSDKPGLVGFQFPSNPELQASLAGKVAVEYKPLTSPTHAYEQIHSGLLAEVYVPVVSKRSGEVLGVVEIYQKPARLFATLHWGRIVIWAVSLGGGLALYVVLLPLVRQVYGRRVEQEALRAHAARLEQEVASRSRELERQSEQLMQAQKMEAVGLLAGGVAHDFNNMLTVILARSQLLLHSLEPDHPLRRQVDLIEETAGRAAGLTRQLLTFSRSQMHAPRALNLNALMAGMVKMMRGLIGEDIELVTVPAADLGPIEADPGQVEQVIMNLVVNSRDAMPRGGRLTLETANADIGQTSTSRHSGVAPGSYVMLAVSDTGVGMDAGIRAHLFEPFFTTKEVGKGTGLGLAIVYGIIKQHRGHIAVESEPGRGTTFRVYLPRIGGTVKPKEQSLALAASPRGAG